MSRLSIRALGPLEVALDGVPVDLGSRKQRAVLALLVTFANRPVSRDRLISEIWGDVPPAKAAHSLQTYVSNLRRLLGNSRIERQPAGYLLHVDDDELDVARFTSELGAARAMGASNPQTVADRVGPVLALWRAEDPFLGMSEDVPALHQEATRLSELRLAAQELWIEAQLALGESIELVPTLREMVNRFPYRESLCGLLMKALQGSGRQVEALGVYRALRSRLVEELGIDPSQELQDLEYRILTQTEPTRTSTTLRNTLPSPPGRLIGRQTEVESAVSAVLDSRIVTITGTAGVGKTRLCIEVASRLADRFADGVFFVDFAAVTSPEDVPRAVIAGLRLNDQSARSPSEVAADFLRHGVLLLVLDNCEHLAETIASLGWKWVNGNADLHVLATSQSPLDIGGERILPLSPLGLPDANSDGVSDSEAMELFLERIRDQGVSVALSEQDRESIRDICRQLDGLPLAIELAAARAHVIGYGEIAARLGDRFALLTRGKRSAPDRHRTLQSAVAWSYSLLGEDEKRVFDRLALLVGPFTLECAEAVGGYDGKLNFMDVLDGLVRRSLVTRVGHDPVRYRMLETLRAFGRAQLESRGSVDLGELARAEFFAGVAVSEAERIRTTEFEDAWRRIDEDLDNIRQAFRWCVSHGRPDLAFDLSRPQWGLVFTGARHHLHEGTVWRELLLDSDPGDAIGARLIAEHSFVSFQMGNQTEAEGFAHRCLSNSGRDISAETLALQVLALCAATNQDTERAIEIASRAIEVGGDHLDAHGLEALVFAYIFGGRGPEAVEVAERILDRADEQTYPLRRIRALALLGAALQAVDLPRSESVLDEAVAVTERLGMDWDLAGAVMARGVTRWSGGDLSGALEDLSWACRLTYEVRDMRRLAQTLEAVGAIVGGAGHVVEAIEVLSASEALRASIGVVGGGPQAERRRQMRTELARSLPGHVSERAGQRGARASAAEAARLGGAVAITVKADLEST